MATLKIYDSVTDEQPSKEFKCFRTTMAINNKLDDYLEEITTLENITNKKVAHLSNDTTEEEINKITEEVKQIKEKISTIIFDIIRLFFPNFTEEDFTKLDIYDYQTFMVEIGELRNRIYNRAAKN